MLVTLFVLVCVAALLGLLWLAQNSPTWAGDAALYILLVTKWVVIVAISLLMILGVAYVIYIH